MVMDLLHYIAMILESIYADVFIIYFLYHSHRTRRVWEPERSITSRQNQDARWEYVTLPVQDLESSILLSCPPLERCWGVDKQDESWGETTQGTGDALLTRSNSIRGSLLPSTYRTEVRNEYESYFEQYFAGSEPDTRSCPSIQYWDSFGHPPRPVWWMHKFFPSERKDCLGFHSVRWVYFHSVPQPRRHF